MNKAQSGKISARLEKKKNYYKKLDICRILFILHNLKKKFTFPVTSRYIVSTYNRKNRRKYLVKIFFNVNKITVL